MKENQQRFPTQERHRRWQLKERYARQLLGSEQEPGQNVLPKYTKMPDLYDKDFPQQEKPRGVGGVIVSRRIAAEIRQNFDTTQLKAFSLEEIKDAAKALGLVLYETQDEFPYSNLSFADNELLIARYSAPVEVEDINPEIFRRLPQLLRNLFKGKKPLVISKVQFTTFPKDNTIIPEVALTFPQPNSATFVIRKLARGVAVGHDPASSGNLILQQLGYDRVLPAISLSENVVFVPLEKLVPSKSNYFLLGTFDVWSKNKGVWYFESEIGNFLDKAANTSS